MSFLGRWWWQSACRYLLVWFFLLYTWISHHLLYWEVHIEREKKCTYLLQWWTWCAMTGCSDVLKILLATLSHVSILQRCHLHISSNLLRWKKWVDGPYFKVLNVDVCHHRRYWWAHRNNMSFFIYSTLVVKICRLHTYPHQDNSFSVHDAFDHVNDFIYWDLGIEWQNIKAH